MFAYLLSIYKFHEVTQGPAALLTTVVSSAPCQVPDTEQKVKKKKIFLKISEIRINLGNSSLNKAYQVSCL